MAMLTVGYTQNAWLIRETLLNCMDYQCAHQALRDVPMASYGYQILAGTKPGEGVVISRDRFGPAHEEFLDSDKGKWFLVQANSDQWIDGCTDRCLAAYLGMQKVGLENVSLSLIRDQVLLLPPDLNSKTIYHSDMNPMAAYM